MTQALKEIDKTSLQLSIHWNTASTDIDLWVVEPEGERGRPHDRRGAGPRAAVRGVQAPALAPLA